MMQQPIPGSLAPKTPQQILSLFDGTNNRFYLTGIQLEVGEKTTPFEHRSYGDELQRCLRYYWQIRSWAGPIYLGNRFKHSCWQWFSVMRTAPTHAILTSTGTSISNVTAQRTPIRIPTLLETTTLAAILLRNMSVTAGILARHLCQCDAELCIMNILV